VQPVLHEALAQRQHILNAAYAIGPDDVLRITVFDHADLSQEVTVAEDGAFVYPFLGQVHAAGLSVRELEQHLVRRLQDGYLVEPQVTVVVAQYRSQSVSVLGAVRQPGVYPLRHGITLQELLSQAGGITPEAAWYALLIRASEAPDGAKGSANGQATNPDVPHIDLDQLFAGKLRQPIQMRGGDTLYVPLGASIFVSGQVQRPGRFRLERDMTVLKAITLAGGFARFAAEHRLRVRRSVAGEPQEFQAQLDDRLQPEDILIVPESVF
jgi:polysaccharide export outer membrane protein